MPQHPVEWRPEGLDERDLDEALATIARIEPRHVAVLVTGSYATGDAGEGSDLDLATIIPDDREHPYRMWFQERARAEPLHVSVGTYTAARWRARDGLAADWALGLPAVREARFVWAAAGVREQLGDPPNRLHPAQSPELEDFVEYVSNLRRAVVAGDGLGMRWHAREATALAPGLLVPLNAVRPVRTPREALDATLALEVTPDGFRDDFLTAFGLTAARDEEVARSGLHLARNLLRYLRQQMPEVDRQPEIAVYLRDGTLERHLGFPAP